MGLRRGALAALLSVTRTNRDGRHAVPSHRRQRRPRARHVQRMPQSNRAPMHEPSASPRRVRAALSPCRFAPASASSPPARRLAIHRHRRCFRLVPEGAARKKPLPLRYRPFLTSCFLIRGRRLANMICFRFIKKGIVNDPVGDKVLLQHAGERLRERIPRTVAGGSRRIQGNTEWPPGSAIDCWMVTARRL